MANGPEEYTAAEWRQILINAKAALDEDPRDPFAQEAFNTARESIRALAAQRDEANRLISEQEQAEAYDPGALGTFAQRALDVPTFGQSDRIIAALVPDMGVEDVRARAAAGGEAHPMAATAGTVTGFVAPLAATGITRAITNRMARGVLENRMLRARAIRDEAIAARQPTLDRVAELRAERLARQLAEPRALPRSGPPASVGPRTPPVRRGPQVTSRLPEIKPKRPGPSASVGPRTPSVRPGPQVTSRPPEITPPTPPRPGPPASVGPKVPPTRPGPSIRAGRPPAPRPVPTQPSLKAVRQPRQFEPNAGPTTSAPRTNPGPGTGPSSVPRTTPATPTVTKPAVRKPPSPKSVKGVEFGQKSPMSPGGKSEVKTILGEITRLINQGKIRK